MHALPPRRRSWSFLAAHVLAASVVLPGAGPGAAAAAGSTASLKPTDPWNTFSADVAIRRTQIGEDGQELSAASALTYRWEQSQVSAGWKTTMTVGQMAGPSAQSLIPGAAAVGDTFPIARLEDAGDGTALRIFDDAGQPIQASSLPASPQLQTLIGPNGVSYALGATNSVRAARRGKEWIDLIVADPARAATRRTRMVKRYGNIVGQVNGRDRLLKQTRDGVIEVLLDRLLAVPVEINVTKNGTLVAHTTISYANGAANMPVRSVVHTERLLANGRGARAVTEVVLANVRLENRSAQ
jgi:hypothetical protein